MTLDQVLALWPLGLSLVSVAIGWGMRSARAASRDRRLDEHSDELDSVTAEVARLALAQAQTKAETAHVRQLIGNLETQVDERFRDLKGDLRDRFRELLAILDGTRR